MKQRLLPVLGASFLMLFTLPAESQVWAGRGELQLQVRADRGGPVAGAVVTLEFLGSRPSAGPAPVPTDASGRASVSGLAEGTWQMEVAHPDFLTYVARVDLTIGRKVEELSVAQRSDGDGTGLFRIRFQKVGRGEAPPAPRETTRPSRPPESESAEAAPEAPATTETDPAPRERTEPASEPDSDPAPPAEEPAALPDPDPTIDEPPVPEPAEPPAPEPEPGLEPEVEEEAASEAMPESQPAEPPTAEDPTPPATPPSVPETEAPAAEVPVPSEPTVRPLARIHRSSDGSCPDCRPGETALSADVTVAPGAGAASCPADAAASVEPAIERLATAIGDRLRGFHGPLIDPGFRDLLSLAPPVARESFLESLGSLASEGSSCRLVAILLPNDTRLGGFRYEARDVDQVADCLPGQECPLPGARWAGNPGRVEIGGRTLVWALFSNDSQDRERHGRLTVYLR